MPIPDTQGVPPFADFDDVKNKVNELVAKYNNLLVNLDSLNVVSLTADHIDAGTINTNLVTILSTLTTGYIRIDGNGMVVNNGAFNTFTVDFNGHVTMTSALVQSALGYPKVELNSAQNLIAAYSGPSTYVAFTPQGTNNVPTLILVENGSAEAFLNHFGNTTTLGTFSGDNLNLQPSGNLQISGSNGVSGQFYVSSTPNGPTNVLVTFNKGIRTG